MEPHFFLFIPTYKMLVPKNRLGNKCPVTSIGVITGSGIRKLFFPNIDIYSECKNR